SPTRRPLLLLRTTLPTRESRTPTISVWLITPTSEPKGSTTGRPVIEFACNRRAASSIDASTATTTGSIVMRSATRSRVVSTSTIMATPLSRRHCFVPAGGSDRAERTEGGGGATRRQCHAALASRLWALLVSSGHVRRRGGRYDRNDRPGSMPADRPSRGQSVRA